MIARMKRVNLRHLLPDVGLIFFSGYVSQWIGLGPEIFFESVPELTLWLAFACAVRVLVLIQAGVYDIIWRYVSLRDAVTLVMGVLASSLVLRLVPVFLPSLQAIPENSRVINTLLLMVSMCAIRGARRLSHERPGQERCKSEGRRTIVYGAGDEGRALVNRFISDPGLKTVVVGFVDKDSRKVGNSICGVKVLGTPANLGDLFKAYHVSDLVISASNSRQLPGDELSSLLQIARANNVHPRLISDLGLSDKSRNRFELFREVKLEDLLNRPRAQIDLSSVRELIQGKRVLVTGAGGSIGSELSRQILGFDPARLMLLDSSEYNLYAIHHELGASASDTSRVMPLLVDLKDRHSLADAISECRPEVVFHAAAYKHVHLVELNPFSAILNNVEGMKNLLDLSEQLGVESFLLISSDKAVNPGGTMGATKRMCELMVSDAARRTGRRYCSVRFGNVLGSSGSLIPLLKEQIRSGGPITITHPEMTRYFMSIPEAVELVLKAASISQPGDISILRMGDPIRIVDIARKLLMLMNVSEQEIPIVFTGMRPGEKMHEEMYICGDEVSTEHPDILVLPKGAQRAGFGVSADALGVAVERLLELARGGVGDAVGFLRAVISPATSLSEGLAQTLAFPSPGLESMQSSSNNSVAALVN